MYSLKEISAPVEPFMAEFNKRFRESLKTSTPLLNIIIRYILKNKGKQMRPMFVFLSAQLNGNTSNSAYNAAALIELLHTATLIHDDVVDESDKRRGFFSINALWKNKIAVLLGDYLLSRGLLLALDTKEYQLLHIVSTAVKEMSEGELLQIEKARFMNISEETYFDIIQKKTASLIAACCSCGAASTGANESIIARMHEFGIQAGIAFQLKDDLMDFDSSNHSGKPSGIDIKERKMSLPVIHMLRNMNTLERRKTINIIKNHHDDNVKIAKIIEKVKNSDGINYSIKKMQEFKDKSLKIIGEFPDNEARKSLEQLVIFTTERNF